MTLYRAWNTALPTTTNTIAGTSYATGAKVMIQLSTSSTTGLRVVEYGVSFNAFTAATPAVVELCVTGTASTMTTGHTTTTIKPDELGAPASRLTMGTTNSGYGSGAITSVTPDRDIDAQYVAPTNQYQKIWVPGTYPEMDVSKFLQLRVNTSATVTALAYIVWEEI